MKSSEDEPRAVGFLSRMLGFVNPHLSLGAETAIRFIQLERDQFAGTPVPPEESLRKLRVTMDERADAAPAGTERRPVTIPAASSPGAAGIRGEWLYPEGLDPRLGEDGVGTADTPTILYFHGGDYWAGSIRSHEDLVSRLAGASSARALMVEYSLAPEHRFPRQLEEALSAFLFLVERCQTAPSSIVIMGDSAGGNLTLVTALSLVLLSGDSRDRQRLRDAGLTALPPASAGAALPRALVLLSPWVNLDIEREVSKRMSTWEEHRATDFLPTVEPDSALYFLPPGSDAGLVCHPLVSPCFAGPELLSRLPRTMVSYGGAEQLRGPIEWFCQSYLAANEAHPDKLVQLCYQGMPHVFHAFGSLIPASETAIDAIGAFVRGLFSP